MAARAAITLPSYEPISSENFFVPVIHLMTGKITSKYKELANNPETSEVWRTAFRKEFGGLEQRDNKTGEKGSNAIFILDHEGINNIPADRKIMYGRSESSETNIGRQSSKISGGNNNKNSRSNDVVGATKQHIEYSTGKVYVH